MREKLIELIQSAVDGCATYWAGLIADHLIANGVVIKSDCEDCASATTRVIDKLQGEIAKRRWIPVTERLPDDWVLCACVDNEVHILCYDYIMDDWDIWGRPNSCYGKPFVTHWMPLPQPPKGE